MIRRAPRPPWGLVLLFTVSGIGHFVVPGFFIAMVPSWLPAWLPPPDRLVAVSGVAELCGAAGLLVPRLRQAAGWALIALLVAVFPANVEMLRRAQAGQGSALWQALLWLRLPLQGLLVWWVWRVAARGRYRGGRRANARGAPPTEKLRTS